MQVTLCLCILTLCRFYFAKQNAFCTHSGCVTSAESVLIEMQNHAELYKALASKAEVSIWSFRVEVIGFIFHFDQTGAAVAVCLSQQSYSSLAAKHGLDPTDVRWMESMSVPRPFD